MFLGNLILFLATSCLSLQCISTQSVTRDLPTIQKDFCCNYGAKAHNVSVSCRENFIQFARYGNWLENEKAKCARHYERCCQNTRTYSLCHIGIMNSKYELSSDCKPEYLDKLSTSDAATVHSCCQHCQKGFLNETACLKNPLHTTQPFAFKTCCNELKNIKTWNPCPSGYKLRDQKHEKSNTICEEINECALPIPPCKPFEHCIDTRDGSYKCLDLTCPENYFRIPNVTEFMCQLNKSYSAIHKPSKKSFSLIPEFIQTFTRRMWCDVQNKTSPFRLIPTIKNIVNTTDVKYPFLLLSESYYKLNSSSRAWFYIENVESTIEPGVLDATLVDKYSFFKVNTTEIDNHNSLSSVFLMKHINGNQHVTVKVSYHVDVNNTHAFIAMVNYHLYIRNMYQIA